MAAIKYPNGSGGWNTIYNLSGMTSHVHGNITNDGKVGTTEGKVLMTSTGGTVIATDMPPTSVPLDSYPVGAIYMSLTDTSPATLFGGTWAAIDAGTFLVAAGTDYTAGSTGGAASVTLTQAQLPYHEHTIQGTSTGSKILEWSGSGMYGVSLGYSGQQGNPNSMYKAIGGGSGQSHENRPPYYAVYMWRRTA